MVNKLKRHLSLRKGFIIGVISLSLFNIILITAYYKLFIDKSINKQYQILNQELENNLAHITDIILNENEYDAQLNTYAQANNLSITIANDNKKTEYNSEKKQNKHNKITISKIINIENEYYLISLSKKGNKINLRIALNFLLFETLNISLLSLFGIFISNLKILAPITNLSKDLNNYKFGIIPKKRYIKSEIDLLQNDFVDLVNSLEEEQQKQNRIIASISHDIKTPLTSILGYSERMIKNPNLSSETKHKYITTIYNKSLSLKEIVEEFDDYLNCNRKDPTKTQKISIKYLVDYLNNYYKEELKEKNIDFKIKTNCKNVQIEVDLPKWKRIFSNIITNSLRHFSRKRKILHISIMEQKEGVIVFEIADNGSGCKEDIEHIFDPFFTTDQGRKISGLGLSICKEIIESHNGTIKAVNNKLNGLSIIFTIKAYKEEKHDRTLTL